MVVQSKFALPTLVLILSFAGPSALGANYFIPQGQREGLMANVGIALNGSEGAAVYNPAGAAVMEASRISASGSLLNASKVEIKGSSTTPIQDKNQSLSFTQIPGMIAGYTQTPLGTAGFFINTEYNLMFSKVYGYNIPLVNGFSETNQNSDSIQLGGLLANETVINKDLRFQYGITAGVSLLEQRSTYHTKVYTVPTNSYTSGFDSTIAKSTNLFARVGLLLDEPSVSYGLFFQPGGTKISSSYSKFAYSVSSTGQVYDTSSTDGETAVSPIAAGIGLRWKTNKDLHLFLDGNQTGQDSDLNKVGFGFGNLTHSVGLGFDYRLQSENHVYGGITGSDYISGKFATARGLMLAGGFNYKVSFIKNYLGAYYSFSDQAEDVATQSAGIRIAYFGIMIGSQYAF